MARILILGVNGQDGSYLAEILHKQGHTVMGAGHAIERIHWLKNCPMTYHSLDIADTSALSQLLECVCPEYVYHVAAIHGPSGFAYEPRFAEVLAVNALSVHTVLEYARKNNNTRLLYASSSKVFGDPLPQVVNEESPKKGTCLYSVTKMTAEGLINYYRMKYSVKVSIVYLFNHESIRRTGEYFFSLLTHGIAQYLSTREKLHVRTLDFWCDWGSAEEYMQLCVRILDMAAGQDFVLATGYSVHARELASLLCQHFHLDMERCIEETHSVKTVASAPYLADNSKLLSAIHAVPNLTSYELAVQIINTISTEKREQ